MIDQRKRIFAARLWLLDLLLTAASFVLAYGFRLLFELEGRIVMPVQVYLPTLAIILPTWAIVLPLFGVYVESTFRSQEQIVRLLKAIGLAWLVSAAVQSFVNPDLPSRLILVFTLVMNYVLLFSHRLILSWTKKHSALGTRHVAVIGSGKGAIEFARTIEKHEDWGLRLTGIFKQTDVREILETGGVDELIIVVDRENLSEFNETFLLCEELGVTATVVLNFFPHSIARMELHELDGFPLLSFSTTPTNEALMLVRRVMDVVLSAVLSALFLPVMLVVAAIIKLTSSGEVLFKQERSGLHGRGFTMYKFRSMVDDAEQLRFELEALNEMDGPVFKSSRDPRITGVGKILRRFSIDELPQLYNVLRGDMSLVGPRPPLPQEVARYERWQRRRLSMKPGITCLWQISGRNEVNFEDWMKLDLTYIDNWSLLLDLKILLKTVPVVLLGRGAK